MATKKKTTAVQAKETATKATQVKAAAVGAKETDVKAAPVTAEKAAETKAAAKRVSKKVSIELQYADKCVDVTSLEGKAVTAWAEATGNAKTAAKSINLYVKPEENKLYYVIEGEAGEIDL